jgi:hypothetical protein
MARCRLDVRYKIHGDFGRKKAVARITSVAFRLSPGEYRISVRNACAGALPNFYRR